MFTFLHRLGSVAKFLLASLRWLVQPPYYGGETLHQMEVFASRCFLPVVATVTPMGMVIAVHGTTIIRYFGAEQLVGSFITVALLRELAPIIAGLAVIAQAGSSMAAEIATMRVREEIDAMESASVNPMQFLVAPRLFAALTVTPMLFVISCATGMAGGFAVAVWSKGVSPGGYLDGMWELVNARDLWVGVLKTSLFGLVVAAISCEQGFSATGGAVGVGRAVNGAVVTSCIVVLLANYFVTSMAYSILG